MKKIVPALFYALTALALLTSACQSSVQTQNTPSAQIKVLAVESFLADITRNVTGDLAAVESLIPLGLDPHAFEPAPRDVVKIAESRIIVANGAGLEDWLDETLQNAGGEHEIIQASAGLASRTPQAGELVEEEHSGGDPHFWLDPTQVIAYVENIRDGMARVDPQHQADYSANAHAYIQQLQDLDQWIQQQVGQIPAGQRLIVTNHESFGYFADRYGFQIIGTIIPSVSTGASPSAQQLARLVDEIRQTGARAIFLETGANPQLAEQIGRETGLKVVTDLYTHSTSAPGGGAPTYIEMMKSNVLSIVNALK